jgi:hypothetical protein
MANQALTFQETLRTLGMLLDQSSTDSAEIVLSATGATVRTSTAWSWPREWSSEALASESARQRNWRAENTPAQHRLEGVRWALRVIGTELDAEGSGPYTILVHSDTVRVQKPDGNERAYTAESLRRRAVLAPHLRGQAPPDAQ